jgi:hypothetical protein
MVCVAVHKRRFRQRVGEEPRREFPHPLVDDVDDQPFAPLRQSVGHGFGQDCRRLEMDGEMQIEQILVEAGHVIILEHRGIVDDQIRDPKRAVTSAYSLRACADSDRSAMNTSATPPFGTDRAGHSLCFRTA